MKRRVQPLRVLILTAEPEPHQRGLSRRHPSLTNGFDALNRLTNRLDGLGQTRYLYTVPGNS